MKLAKCLGWAFLFLCSLAFADESTPVAILVEISGAVAAGKGMEPWQALDKLRSGDTLELAPGAKLRLVYFDSGRQETWRGKARVVVGEKAGTAGPLKPEVEQVPALIAGQLKRTPAKGALGRSAMIVTRAGGANASRIAAARSKYEQDRASLGRESVLPDLAYLNELIALQAFAEGRAHVDVLKQEGRASDVVRRYEPLLSGSE